MTRRSALGSLVLVSLIAFGPSAALAAAPDEVTTDASGREISRVHSNADGSSQHTSTKYAEGQARTVVREEINPRSRVTQRVVEQYDSSGRLAQRKEVTVDATGREKGQRLSYRYDPDGRPRVTTEVIK